MQLDNNNIITRLIINQKISSKQLRYFVENNISVDQLTYSCKDKFTPELISKAIDVSSGLTFFYIYCNLGKKLTSGLIDKCMDKGYELYWLYQYSKMSPENLDKAINIGIKLGDLIRFQNDRLSYEQKTRINKILSYRDEDPNYPD